MAYSTSSKQPKNPRLIQPRRTPSSPSSSTTHDGYLPHSRPAPSPRQFSKHPEWIYRRPKLSSSSSDLHTGVNDPRTRAPLPNFTPGPCPDRRNDPGCIPSNDGSFGWVAKQPPSPPSSLWSLRRKRGQSNDQATGSTQWDNFDHPHLTRIPPKLSPGNIGATQFSLQQPCRSASDSTSSSSSSSSSLSSRPHTPPLQHYQSTPDNTMTSDRYPRSILTRTSSTSTQKHAPSILAPRYAGRQRSGSCSKSVKFVETPTVHYASIDWDWVIPDEQESDVDTESEVEEEDEGSFPPPALGKILGFNAGARSVDTFDSGASSVSGAKLRSLQKLAGFKRDHSLSKKRPADGHPKKQVKPSISGPFALGTLPTPPLPPPSPPLIAHPVKGTSVSLRSAPSCDSFRSVKSSGGRSTLSVKSLRSLPGSLKTGAQGLKDWFKGRRVIID